MNIDLSILKDVPKLDCMSIVEITPLAPLSMVSDMPGSFYKTLHAPNKKMLCGLFENILGWHIDWADRNKIINDVKTIRKKQGIRYVDNVSGSTYKPLLMDYFEIADDVKYTDFKNVCFFNDLWSRGYRRSDTYKHMNGCRNIDFGILSERYSAFDCIDGLKVSSNEKTKKKDEWFKEHIGCVPYYYSTPTTREFVDFEGRYLYKLKIDCKLLDLLLDGSNNNIGYLGNSEGWVNLKIMKI